MKKIKDFFPNCEFDVRFLRQNKARRDRKYQKGNLHEIPGQKSTLIGAITFFTIKWINYVSIGVVGIFANEIRHHSGQNLLRTHSAVPREYTTDLLNNLPKEPVTQETKCFFSCRIHLSKVSFLIKINNKRSIFSQ